MKIKIIRPTIFRKKQVMPSEEPIEVTEKEAVEMVGAGKAVIVKETAVETTDNPMADVETSVTVEPAQAEMPAETEEKPKRGKSKKASE